MLSYNIDDEPLDLSDGTDDGQFLLAAFFVPLDKKAPTPTVEEWARRSKVEWFRHKQYRAKPENMVAEGLWGGNIFCEFYIAILEEHTCIMIASFRSKIRNLAMDDVNPNLKEPPTWPVVQLFQDTCLSLGAEVMIFSYWSEHANLRWVQKEYPLVLKRDPWLLMEREYGLLYVDKGITEYFMPEAEVNKDRDYVNVEGGGVLIFGEHGRKRWWNYPWWIG